MRANVMLADAAQAIQGKLFVLGGGWNMIKPGGPSAVAILIQVPWDQTNRKHHWLLELMDGDGEPVVVPTPLGEEQPVRLEGDFEVGRPPGTTAGSELGVPLAVNLGPLPLALGRYVWRLSIDGESHDYWRQPFDVIAALPGEPQPPAPEAT
jgi:hypothetical protein